MERTSTVPEQIHPEDRSLIINAGFAERFAGFERILTQEGWRWTPPNSDAQSPTLMSIEELPKVEGTRYNLIEFLDKMCKLHSQDPAIAANNGVLLWSVNIQPGGAYAATIGRMCDEGDYEPMHGHLDEDPAVAIAVAMLKTVQFSPSVAHRELFPHRYLATNNA
jgi:hypothetical protein